MGLFSNLFGKKEEGPSYDEINIHNLETGYLLEFDLKVWEVKNVYEYDWGNNFFTVEYQLDNGEEVINLHVEEDDELELSVSRAKNVNAIDPNLRTHIVDSDTAPKQIVYDGKTYYLDDESPAGFRNLNESTWHDFVNYDYVTEDEKHFINIEQWAEGKVQAAVGTYHKEFEFSNFLARESS